MRRALAVFLLLCAALSSPRAERKVAAFGLLGGINIASFYGEDVKDLPMRFWPVLGANLSFNLPHILGLEIDVLYASRGGAFKIADTIPGINLVHTLTLHTFTIPCLLKITLPVGQEAHPILFAGPALAIPFSRDASSEYIGVDSNGQVSPRTATPIIPPEELVEYDILFTVGAGLEFGLGSVQLRANIAKGTLDKRNQSDVRTMTLEALAGFNF